MTKKDKIIKMFDEKEWTKGFDGVETKMLTYSDFREIGLQPTVEYGETHNDVLYARRVLNSLGYRVLIGANVFVSRKITKEDANKVPAQRDPLA